MTAIEHKLKVRFPRKWHGVRLLLWLSLRRCPFHHARLVSNPPYDHNLYGYCCAGVGIWPNGLCEALRWNYRADLNKDGSDE
jgi:hypothetical protein